MTRPRLGYYGPVLVELTDIAAPARFARLPDALVALWAAMAVLPLGDYQHDCFRYYLTRPDAVLRITEYLARDGDVTLSFLLSGELHLLRIRPSH